MADDEDPDTAWVGDYCLRPYNPYSFGGGRNPNFVRATDGRLLDFKQGQDYAVKAETAEFMKGLDALDLPKGTILVVVPGHEASDTNEGKPLSRVAQVLAQNDNRYVARVNTLIRTTTIPKLAKGGDRSVEGHLKSMALKNAATLMGATVVVLDDTVTSGHSLAAARQLLSEAGAKRIAAVGLARTVKYF